MQLQYDSAQGLPVNKTERGDGSGVCVAVKQTAVPG